MLRYITLAAALILCTASAHAWTVGPQSGGPNAAASSDKGAAAAAAAAATASASATGGNVAAWQQSTGGTASAAGGQGGAVIVNGLGNGGGAARFPASTAVAPPIYTANGCAGSGVSAAVQTGVFGVALGTGNRFDDACRLGNLGEVEVAFEYLCLQNPDIRRAARNAGKPCAADRAAPAPPAPREQPVALPVVGAGPAPTEPDWCQTLSDDAERRAYAYICARHEPAIMPPRHPA